MQRFISKLTTYNGARMLAANRAPLMQTRHIQFNNMQMLQLGILNVATRRLMATMFQKENESKMIRNKLFNIRKKAEDQDLVNTYTSGQTTNLEGKDFLLVGYEQPKDFILLNSPED